MDTESFRTSTWTAFYLLATHDHQLDTFGFRSHILLTLIGHVVGMLVPCCTMAVSIAKHDCSCGRVEPMIAV